MIYKKTWKYILIKNESYIVYKLYRIKALKNFSDVTKGDIGGFVGGYYNLSQKGNCWIYGNASISKNTVISEDDTVIDYAMMLKNQIYEYSTSVPENFGKMVSGNKIIVSK